MARYNLTVAWLTGSLSSQSLGAAAVAAVATIPGTALVAIESETEAAVVISYDWTREDKFWETQTHLAGYGLTRTDWQQKALDSAATAGLC